MVVEKKDADADVKISVAVDATQETESLAATPAAVSFGSSFLCVSAEIITTIAVDAAQETESLAATAAGFL